MKSDRTLPAVFILLTALAPGTPFSRGTQGTDTLHSTSVPACSFGLEWDTRLTFSDEHDPALRNAALILRSLKRGMARQDVAYELSPYGTGGSATTWRYHLVLSHAGKEEHHLAELRFDGESLVWTTLPFSLLLRFETPTSPVEPASREFSPFRVETTSVLNVTCSDGSLYPYAELTSAFELVRCGMSRETLTSALDFLPPPPVVDTWIIVVLVGPLEQQSGQQYFIEFDGNAVGGFSSNPIP